jgi:transcriptional regulator with XRE-family HTH domain
LPNYGASVPKPIRALTIPPRVVDGDFAGWLSDAMDARGLSTRMLEVRTGLDHTTIYRLTHGKHQPTLATAIALFQVLAVDADHVSKDARQDRRSHDSSLL